MLRNPFDPHESGPEPFPPLADALRSTEVQSETTPPRVPGDPQSPRGWSVETVAGPALSVLSPRSTQPETAISADANDTTEASALPRRQQQQQQERHTVEWALRSSLATTTGSLTASFYHRQTAFRPNELHRRCLETMQLCEARVREREQKLARLHIPASKLKLKRHHLQPAERRKRSTASSAGASASTPPRPSPARKPPERVGASRDREPLTPVIATRLRFDSIDISPIPMHSAEKTILQPSRSLEFTPESKSSTIETRSAMAAGFETPPVHRERRPEQPTTSIVCESGVSSRLPRRIAPDEVDEEHKSEDKENMHRQRATPLSIDSSSSPQTISLLSEVDRSKSTLTFSPPSPPGSSTNNTTSSPSDAEKRTISALQASFVAAIEAEAEAETAIAVPSPDVSAVVNEDNKPSGVGPLRMDPTTSPWRKPATSVAAIYQEAKALGISEPTAQWEYVQLIRKQNKGR